MYQHPPLAAKADAVLLPRLLRRARIALLIGAALMLPDLLRLFALNSEYFTFNVFRGILQPIVAGGALLSAVVLAVLLLEMPVGLMRYWLARVLAAAVLVNLGIEIFHGAIDLNPEQALAKVGVELGSASGWLPKVANVLILGFAAYKCRSERFIGELYRVFAILVAVFAALAAFRSAPAIFVEVAETVRRPAAPQAFVPRSVVWVIFDGLDQGELTRAMAQGHAPNFQQLIGSSFSATAARSPTAATLTSIPRLLTGERLESVKTEGRQLTIAHADGRSEAFGAATTLVGAISPKHGPVKVLGFYHPYCRFFPEMGECRAYAISNMPGLVNFLIPAAHNLTLSQSKRVLRWFGVDVNRYGKTFEFQMGHITRQQFADVSNWLAPGTAALHFLHFNIPHVPRNRHGMEVLGWDERSTEDPYHFNLRHSDRLLGQVLGKLREAKAPSRTLLIVSADHGRRPDGWRTMPGHMEADEFRRVPFIAWMGDAASAQSFDARFETSLTRELVERFLAGEVDDLAGVRAFLAGRAAR